MHDLIHVQHHTLAVRAVYRPQKLVQVLDEVVGSGLRDAAVGQVHAASIDLIFRAHAIGAAIVDAVTNAYRRVDIARDVVVFEKFVVGVIGEALEIRLFLNRARIDDGIFVLDEKLVHVDVVANDECLFLVRGRCAFGGHTLGIQLRPVDGRQIALEAHPIGDQAFLLYQRHILNHIAVQDQRVGDGLHHRVIARERIIRQRDGICCNSHVALLSSPAQPTC